MSDRAIPVIPKPLRAWRAFTVPDGNAQGKSVFAQVFIWRRSLGLFSTWFGNEAQKLAGQDPDFNRKEPRKMIQNGRLPEWELACK